MGDEIRVALFDFMGDLMGGQLSFQEGDFIKQLDDPNAPQGWAMGEIDDFSGYFPLNFTVSWDFDKHGTEPQYKPEGHKTAPNVSPPPFSHSQQLDFTASFGGNFGGGGGGGRGFSALDSLSNLIDSILPPPGEDLGLPPAPPPAAAPQNGAQEEEEELTPLDRFKIPAAKPDLIKKIDKPPPAPKEPVKQPEPESEAPKGPSMQELNEMKRQAREQRQMEMKKAKEEEERRLKEEKEKKKAEKKKANADAASGHSAAETAATTASGPYSSISSSSAVPTFGYANNNLPKDPAALKRVSIVQLPGMAPLPDMKQLTPLEVTPLQIRSTFRDQVAQQQQQQPQEEQSQEESEEAEEEEAPVIHPTAIPMPQPMAVPAPTPVAFHPQPTPSADPSSYNNEPRLPPKRTAPPPLPSRGNKPTSGPSEDDSQQQHQPQPQPQQPQPPFGAASLQRPVPPPHQPGNRPVPPQGRPIPPSPMARPSPPMNGGVAFGGAATPPPRPVSHMGPGAAGDGRPPMLPRPSSNRQSGQVGTLPSPRRETTGEQPSFRQQQQQAAPQQPQPQGAGPAFNRRGSAPNLNVRIQPKSAQFAPPSPAAAPAAGTNGVAQQQHSHQQEEPRAPAQPPRPRGESVMVTVLEQVTCLHNFAGDATKNILAFNAGDVITVKRKNDSGWWTGELNGTLGYFPSNYTKPVPQQQPPQPHPPQQSPLQPSPPAGARHMGFGGGAASNTNNNASNAQTISGRAAPPPRPSAQSRFSLGAPIPSASMKVGGGTTITDRSKALNFQGFGAPHPTLGGGGAGGGVGDGGLSAGGVPSRNISSPNVRAQMIQPATAMAQSSSENSLRGPQGDAAGADGKKKKFGLFSKKKGGK